MTLFFWFVVFGLWLAGNIQIPVFIIVTWMIAMMLDAILEI